MKKENIVILIWIVLVLIVGILWVFFSSPISDIIESFGEDCKGLEGNDHNICFLELAKEKNDLSYCKEVKDHNMYYSCVDSVWEKGDCSYESINGLSINNCYFDLATETKNLSYCYYIDSDQEKYDCIKLISEFVVENELLFLCLGNKQCYDNYVNSLESCQTIFEQDLKYLVDFDQESLFDDCIINKAKQTKDPSLCEQLNEDNLGCHLSLAENKEEVLDFCSSLDNSEISGVSPFNQLNVLDNNDFEEISFFSCVLMGWRISNFDLCQDLPEIDKSSDIYKEFKSKNLSLFLDQGKDSCYFSKAVSEKEAVVCDSIKDLSIKNICKSKILNNCRSLEEEEEKKLCNLNLSDEGDCLDQFSEENIHLCLDLLK